jgi:NTP pyrophosphatase (non-canonical NTP hydrolase)
MVENSKRPTHPELVAALAKPGEDILSSLTPEQCHQWHMASALQGEAGELFDAIKKFVIYGKDLDRENVVEELGDMEFYMEGLRAALGITRDECIEANIDKLSTRYSAGKYSDQAAQERADKAPGADRKFFGQNVEA